MHVLIEGLEAEPPVTKDYWDQKKKRLTERLGKIIGPMA